MSSSQRCGSVGTESSEVRDIAESPGGVGYRLFATTRGSETCAPASDALSCLTLTQSTGGDCRRVTPVYTVSVKLRELQRLHRDPRLGQSSDYVRPRCEYVRIYGLENRQSRKTFVSSNLTLSANHTIVELSTCFFTYPIPSIGFAQDTHEDTGQFTRIRLAGCPNPAVGTLGTDGF
jgi:hypothetical protein